MDDKPPQSDAPADTPGMDFRVVTILKTLADPTRLRLMRLLHAEELNVQELSRILQIAQPSVSRHLAVLRSGGLIANRREGNRVYCSAALPDTMPEALREFISQLGRTPHNDLDHLDAVLAERARSASQFADRTAACWDNVGKLLHQSSALLTALADLAPNGMEIADLGTGTGLLLPFLSRMASRVHAVDQSHQMLRRAQRRCETQELANVNFHQRALEDLTQADLRVHASLLHFVLHQVASPASVLDSVGHVLHPGGRLVIVDRLPHQDEEAKQTFGSLWLGFSHTQLADWLEQSEMTITDWEELPATENGQGPREVFVLAAVKKS